MRRLACLVLLSLAVAAPAAAGPGGKITVVKPTGAAARSDGLRGAQRAVAAPPPAPLVSPANAVQAYSARVPAALAQAWQAPIPQAGGDNALQCRASCAQTYYFCSAGGDEDCPGRWSQCAAACTGAAALKPAY